MGSGAIEPAYEHGGPAHEQAHPEHVEAGHFAGAVAFGCIVIAVALLASLRPSSGASRSSRRPN